MRILNRLIAGWLGFALGYAIVPLFVYIGFDEPDLWWRITWFTMAAIAFVFNTWELLSHEDKRENGRLWTYPPREWDGTWYERIGVPTIGTDEHGRRTILWGTGITGYIVLALWTCHCPDCSAVRAQTAAMKENNG